MECEIMKTPINLCKNCVKETYNETTDFTGFCSKKCATFKWQNTKKGDDKK